MRGRKWPVPPMKLVSTPLFKQFVDLVLEACSMERASFLSCLPKEGPVLLETPIGNSLPQAGLGRVVFKHEFVTSDFYADVLVVIINSVGIAFHGV